MEDIRVRYAPSPTGFAHIGNIRTAIFDWLYAKHTGGKFILRIEDTDRARIVPGALEEIFESLRWLGATWDEGPEVGGEYGPYIQSERLHIYKRYAQQLLEQGDAYYCFCTPERLAEMRKHQEEQNLGTGYDRLCLGLSNGEIKNKQNEGLCGVLRFKIPDDQERTSFVDLVRGEISFETRLLDDFVIMKSDGYPTYHFASIVDDHLMKITHVIRGEEWISSTPKHVLLYDALGWEPPVWVHPSLILGPDKSKLSKRHGAVRFLDYRDRGFLPEAMMNFITMLGWSPGEDQEIFGIEELIQRFTLEGIVNHPVVFDIQKAEWMNGVYIREADLDRLTSLCLPYLQDAGLVPAHPSKSELSYVREVVALEQDRMKVLSDIVELSRFFFEEAPEFEDKGFKKYLTKEYVPTLLRHLFFRIGNVAVLTTESVEEVVREIGDQMGLSGGQIIHPIRMAVTGRTVGPGLFELMATLGKDRILSRLNRALNTLGEVVAD